MKADLGSPSDIDNRSASLLRPHGTQEDVTIRVFASPVRVQAVVAELVTPQT